MVLWYKSIQEDLPPPPPPPRSINGEWSLISMPAKMEEEPPDFSEGAQSVPAVLRRLLPTLPRLDVAILVLLGLPVLLALRGGAWFSNGWGQIDSWIYTGFFRSLRLYQGTLFPETYYGPVFRGMPGHSGQQIPGGC